MNILALDVDNAGNQSAAWFQKNYPNSKRLIVPYGKDIGEYHQLGGNVRELISAFLNPSSQPATQAPQVAITVCRTESEARQALDALDSALGPIALEVKAAPSSRQDTASMDPHLRGMRLVCLYPGGDRVFCLDMTSIPTTALQALASMRLVTHNAVKALAVLSAACVQVPNMDCTLLMHNAWRGGRAEVAELAPMIGRRVGMAEEQYAGALANEHFIAAAGDVLSVHILLKFLNKKLDERGTRKIYELMCSCQPAVAQLHVNGLGYAPSSDDKDAYSEFLSPVTGRLHPVYELAKADTGRFGCHSPSLQNVSRDESVRSRFCAPAGRSLVVADYNQIELRIAAELCRDASLRESFAKGEDLHAKTAATIAGISIEQVTLEMRRKAKAVNFGMLFGQTPQGLVKFAQEQYGVAMTLAEAESAHKAFLRSYPSLAKWMDDATKHHSGEESILVRTPAGRIRRLPFGSRGNRNRRLNTPIQGGAAEVLLAALKRLPVAIAGLDAKFVHMVHDEIILEVADAHVEQAKLALTQAMTQGMLDIFPQAVTTNLVDVNAGPNWAQAK